jgi:SSS family solute:Na+ symporter
VTRLFGLLIAYAIGLIVLGVWIGRRVRGPEEFFVGGRALGAGLIFATFLAPNIGAGSTVGATALAYHQGLAAWWWNGSAGLGSLILAFWIGPRMWREATRLRLLTVGDFLEHHFGKGVRTLAAVIIWLGSLFILCAQLDGAAAVLTVAGGLSHTAGCFIGALVMTAYFVMGGLSAAARVNSIQLLVKLGGFALATPIIVLAAGGWDTISSFNPIGLGFWRGSSATAGWPLLFLIGPAFFLSPGLLQKAFGARDERALRRGVALNGVGLMIFAMIPVLLGLAARTLYPGLADADVALTVLTHTPLIIGGLALAAVFSAEMSAADAVLFMLATSGARDIYKGLFRPDASDAELLRAARVMAVVGGVVGFGLTFVYTSVVGALTLFYSLMVVTLFAPILGGLFFPQAGRWAALAAMVVGVATLLVTSVVTGGAGYGWVTPPFLGLVTSGFTYLILAIL